jgi:hypothetical protein
MSKEAPYLRLVWSRPLAIRQPPPINALAVNALEEEAARAALRKMKER